MKNILLLSACSCMVLSMTATGYEAKAVTLDELHTMAPHVMFLDEARIVNQIRIDNIAIKDFLPAYPYGIERIEDLPKAELPVKQPTLVPNGIYAYERQISNPSPMLLSRGTVPVTC